MRDPMTISCDQCEMLSINGVPCHETGCPNEKKTWRDGEWVKMISCLNCGSEYEDADEAYNCCSPFDDGYDDPDRLEAGIQGVAPFFDVEATETPKGCGRTDAACNRPEDHMVHSPLYRGKFIPSYQCIGHRFVTPTED